MRLSNGILVLLSTGWTIQALKLEQSVKISYDRTSNTGDQIIRERTKRASNIIGPAVMIGIRATKSILKDATPIRSSSTSTHHVYEKLGGFKQAKKDFDSAVEDSWGQMFPTFGYVLIYAGVCVIQIQMMTQSEHNSSGQTHYTYELKLALPAFANRMWIDEAGATIKTFDMNDFPRQRHKRTAKIISAAIMIGLRAKRALLNNARPTGRSRAQFKMYKKSGGIDQALNDFESVNPTIVMKSGGIIQAEVGDLTLLLISQGRKNPILDIYKVSKTRGKAADQVNEGAVTIIYED